MSKAVTLGFVAAAVVLAVFYGLGAFYAWDANPGEWSAGLRFFVGSLALFFSTVAWCITASEVGCS